jgi:hypothetical protein
LFGLIHADKTAAITILFHRFSHNDRLAPQQPSMARSRFSLRDCVWSARLGKRARLNVRLFFTK